MNKAHLTIACFTLLCITENFLQASCSLVFPKKFLKGVALSTFQNGGSRHGRNNWNIFEEQKNLLGRSTIKHGHSSAKAPCFWDKAFHDIGLIKDLGCNALRFSVEWAEIEPKEGLFNQEAMDFYEHYCDELLKAGISPSITLHHFTHPDWFDELGGFEKAENIHYFVRFCKKVFERLHSKVSLWYTINEPTVFSFMGYISGWHAPGKIMSLARAGVVLGNLLKSHVSVYRALKAMDGGNSAQIGIVHQVLQAKPYFWWNPAHVLTAKILNFCFAHDCVKKFLKTGIFHYEIPGLSSLWYEDENASKSYDFIGINYYSHVIVGLGATCYPNETMTDMEYPSFPRGIYEAIKDMAELGVPLYITENGIPDQRDVNRDQFIKEYLAQVHRALADGYDVRGYFYWTLMDNFEWDRGFTIKFGLYDVNHETQERYLREGAKAYRDFFTLE